MTIFGRRNGKSTPMPADLLEWQVRLRDHTMHARNGAPHVGVAPLLSVRAPGSPSGCESYSIICGLLPREDLLEDRTRAFREIYEKHVEEGARTVYDHGVTYLKNYYTDPGEFDPTSITTLLQKDLPVVEALRADPRCALVFYVFDLQARDELERLRTTQLDGEAEVLTEGPVYDNVWWHNTLFHGPADDHVIIHFRHRASLDTRFGRREVLA
ncbi:MAG: hypothetical protein ACQGVK_00400 [Myxococcota bacterium]